MSSRKGVIIAWRAEDINCLREDWSDEKCQSWLNENSEAIIGACVKSGFDAIETLLAIEEQQNKEGQ